jgi:2-dehydro-3-deoxygalactonokinase
LPVVASGMVGSAQGWKEVPYVRCPADAGKLIAGAKRVATVGGHDLWLTPGLRHDPPSGAPDVMRGEETQIAGALEMHPAWASRAIFLLPGTHSKWVQVESGDVIGFATHMTGELYALLRQHSILGRLMPAPVAVPPKAKRTIVQAAAFAAGVNAARSSAPGALGHQLFAVRTLGLTGQLAHDALADYLSGLLIGHELVDGLAASAATREAGAPLVLVGDAALCRRYVEGLALFDVRADAVLDNTAPCGLWAFARAAGLLPRD